MEDEFWDASGDIEKELGERIGKGQKNSYKARASPRLEIYTTASIDIVNLPSFAVATIFTGCGKVFLNFKSTPP